MQDKRLRRLYLKRDGVLAVCQELADLRRWRPQSPNAGHEEAKRAHRGSATSIKDRDDVAALYQLSDVGLKTAGGGVVRIVAYCRIGP
jgi:hypothetical protein